MFNKGGGAAQSGIQMLLKSLGFDPVDFLAKLQDAQKTAVQVVKQLDDRLKAIETRLENMERLMQKPEQLAEATGSNDAANKPN